VSSLRLFFALWPTPPMQAALVQAARAALERARGARAESPEKLHLTLAFLGSVAPERLEALHAVVERARRACTELSQPLALTLDRLEHWRKAQILCATATQVPAGALQLSRHLKECLLAADFAPDLKPFRPHVTIARRASTGSSDALGPVRWSFDEITLVESRTLPSGSSYSRRAAWPLCEPHGS